MRTRIAVAVVVTAVAALAVAAPAAAQAPVSCSWTDNPIVAGTTPIRARHLNEIRTCLDAILANWPGDPPQPPGGADFTVQNVRQYDSVITFSHWLYFDVVAHRAIPRLALAIRFEHGFSERTLIAARS